VVPVSGTGKMNGSSPITPGVGILKRNELGGSTDDNKRCEDEASLAPSALHLIRQGATVGVAHTTCCVGREATRGWYGFCRTRRHLVSTPLVAFGHADNKLSAPPFMGDEPYHLGGPYNLLCGPRSDKKALGLNQRLSCSCNAARTSCCLRQRETMNCLGHPGDC